MSMYKVAVVGDKDSILGFKALGVSTFPVAGEGEAAQVFKTVLSKDFAVVCITENIAQHIMPQVEEANKKMLPSVVFIPNNQGVLELGKQQMKKSAERAIGVDILFGKEGG